MHPRQTLSVMSTVRVLLVILILAVVALIALLLRLPSDFPLRMGVMGIAFVMLPMTVGLWALMERTAKNARDHIVGIGHLCQCRECGRTHPTVAPPLDVRPSTKPIPQERRLSAPLMLAFVALTIPLLVVMAVGLWNHLPWRFPAIVFMAAIVALLVFVVVTIRAWQGAIRDAKLSPWHGCLCRWCSRPGPTSPEQPSFWPPGSNPVTGPRGY